MAKLKLWNKTDSVLTIKGDMLTPDEFMTEYPITRHVPIVLEMTGDVVMGYDPLSKMCQDYGVDETLPEGEKLAALSTAIDRARHPSPEPTAEERIAAAMEFQNMVTLMNLEVSMDVEVAKKL